MGELGSPSCERFAGGGEAGGCSGIGALASARTHVPVQFER